MTELRLCPITLKQAQEFVKEHHRHHGAPVGHKFSVGLQRGDTLVGVAIAGRPVARALDDGTTLEVIRTCTLGVENANSMLYGAIRRAAKALGYSRLVTYTQEGETGASLRAAGWLPVAELPPRTGWDTPSRRREPGVDNVARTRWEVAA